MRILLEYRFDHVTARWLYGSVACALRRRGMEVDVVQKVEGCDVAAYDVLISHDFVDEDVRHLPRLGCWGGRVMLRPASLDLLRDAGLPVMSWARAANRAEVLDLFAHWGVERLLVKRSRTMKGAGVWLFDRANVERVEWNAAEDVFCPEVNAADGTVYKAELFGGRLLLAFMWQRPPLQQTFAGFQPGTAGFSSRRRLVRLPAETRDRICRLSALLTGRGFGYCSLDMMRAPGGELVAIEINTGQVATWWSARFLRTPWRYAGAVAAVIRELERHPPRAS